MYFISLQLIIDKDVSLFATHLSSSLTQMWPVGERLLWFDGRPFHVVERLLWFDGRPFHVVVDVLSEPVQLS